MPRSSWKTRPTRAPSPGWCGSTDGRGGTVGEVVLGKKRQEALSTGKAGTYVRKPGDPQTWLTNAELRRLDSPSRTG